ncbi:MAG TPA: Fe-S-containing hydro-lyase [bacterium]|nr:Fe-S-containing hydro-lyase [bacterium]
MSDRIKRISAPLDDAVLEGLLSGDSVLISGVIYTARDSAHKRIVSAMNKGEDLPFDLRGQIIYYVGPAPAKPGEIIGSAGPTTSCRMDTFAPVLIEAGLKGMIGKGNRTQGVIDAMKKFRAVYFAAIGGAGALMSGCIKSAEVIAYPDLGPEAVRRLEVEDMPVIVANDIFGGDVYEEGFREYRKTPEEWKAGGKKTWYHS